MTINNKVVKGGGGHDENNMNINNKVVKKGTLRKQYEHKQQGCEKVVKRGHDENNMTLNNNVVKKGGDMTKTI